MEIENFLQKIDLLYQKFKSHFKSILTEIEPNERSLLNLNKNRFVLLKIEMISIDQYVLNL